MQSLNFENLNIGDIVLTVPKTKWHNIGNLGMSTSLYVVQSVDTENLTAVVANIGNGTANLLTTSTDGQTTIAPHVWQRPRNHLRGIPDVARGSYRDAHG